MNQIALLVALFLMPAPLCAVQSASQVQSASADESSAYAGRESASPDRADFEAGDAVGGLISLLVLVALAAAAASLSGCLLLAVGMVAVAASSTNNDPIAFQDGVATRVYTITFDRCCSSVDTALKGLNATVDPAGIREADRAAWSGKLADGRPFTIKALSQNLITQVDVKVGTEDMEEDRTAARDLHARIDDDVEVIRRHYPEGFPTVWTATEKTQIEGQQKVNPNNQIGRIAGKLKDGTPVVITLQLIAESRTRVTVEVGSKPTPEAQQQALELAQQISKALGVEAEEEKK